MLRGSEKDCMLDVVRLLDGQVDGETSQGLYLGLSLGCNCQLANPTTSVCNGPDSLWAEWVCLISLSPMLRLSIPARCASAMTYTTQWTFDSSKDPCIQAVQLQECPLQVKWMTRAARLSCGSRSQFKLPFVDAGRGTRD